MGIGIYLWAGVAVLIIIFLSFFLITLWKVFHNKISPIYQIFPILIIVGYVLMNFHSSTDALCGNYEVVGTVKKVQSTEYGYKLWLKDVSAQAVGVGVDSTRDAIAYVDQSFNRGDVVAIKGECSTFDCARNPGEFDVAKYYKSLKVDYKIYGESVTVIKKNSNFIYTFADKISDKLTNCFYTIAEDKYASVMCAMLLGNKDDLDGDIYDLFSAGGIGHILAISGLHISIIGMGLYKFIKRLGAGYVPAMCISGAIILFYGVMTGNGISTVRALIMFLLAVYANVVGRTYDLVSAACFAGFLMLLDSPMLVYNGGFWLSFMAIAGIGGINPVITKIFDVRNSLIKSLVGGLSVQLATVPVIMYLYYEIPTYSILLNLVVIPLMTYVMVCALLGGVLGCFSEWLGRRFIGLPVYILKLYEFLCEKSLALPGAQWICGKPELWQVFLYYGLLWFFLWLVSNKCQKRYFAGVLVAFLVIIFRFNNSFEVVFLDVSQGDGIFIRTDKATYLVDGGSSDNDALYEYTLRPFLMSEGVSVIDYAFVTHPDEDHCSGLKDLLFEGKIEVKVLALPYISEPDEAYMELVSLARDAGADVITLCEGMTMSDGEIGITCLNPAKDYVASDRNSYSTVLKVSYGEFDMLLTGDISSKEEALLEDLEEVELLKVAHHGSKYSSDESFLALTSPKIAVISCGEGNSYGHPHQETLDRLSACGSKVLVTANEGAVLVSVGKEVKVRGYVK